MDKQLLSILEMLKKIDKCSIVKNFSKKQLEKEEQNISEINEILKKLNICLANLESIDKKDKKNVCSQLYELNYLIDDILWQYDQVHDMIGKMMSRIVNLKLLS